MTPEQIEDLKKSLEKTVRETVNGKVDNMERKLKAYYQEDMAWKEIDQQWKKEAQPSIDLGKNLNWGGKVAVGFMAFGAGLVAILGGLVRLIVYLKGLK